MKIIDIIKILFNKLKLNKTKLIEEKTIEEIEKETGSYDTKRDKFSKSIYKSEKIELGDLQRKLENNQISINSINIFEVMDLIDKYQNEINELKIKIH